jgi:hypothetical protein
MASTGEQLRFRGLEKAVSKNKAELVLAQNLAELLSIVLPVVTSDDVREAFAERYGRELEVGNSIGALFSKKKWVCVGRVKSKRESAHARWIIQWKPRKQVRPPEHAPAQPFDVGVVNGTNFCVKCSLEVDKCTCVPNTR